MASSMTKSFIAYHGPSLFDGAPIIVVATPHSHNMKTGAGWQTWVLRADVAPFDALKTGEDVSICGDCKHRPDDTGRRTCYVSLFTGPLGIYRAWERGAYPALTLSEATERLSGAFVRVSAYGDPAAVRFEWWDRLLSGTSGWVGYTHQWKSCDQRFRSLLMASVESADERALAEGTGWRTFRARRVGAPIERGEFQCPASDEAGHRTTCDKCRLCRGQSSPAKSVSIELHGRSFKPKRGDDVAQARADLKQMRERIADGKPALFVGSYRAFQRAVFALKMYARRHNEQATFKMQFDKAKNTGTISR